MPPAETIGANMRRRLAGFARTLRDNGFAVGLAETRDALAILVSPAALQPALLQPALRALFCATRSDWERFDEIFAAYWQGRGMRRAQRTVGTPGASRSTTRHIADSVAAQPPQGVPDAVEQGDAQDGGNAADSHDRRSQAARSERLGATDLRYVVDPDEIAETHALAERLAHRMRARLVRREQARRRGRRLDLRRTIHRSISHGGTPIDLVWRRRK
ncbi:MAG TPA: VWA domain-containing protein, partial [Candidatus Angelobacter sp.]|nr:VWA domain-containing protein [Candidatus Angelobacter sp.]